MYVSVMLVLQIRAGGYAEEKSWAEDVLGEEKGKGRIGGRKQEQVRDRALSTIG